ELDLVAPRAAAGGPVDDEQPADGDRNPKLLKDFPPAGRRRGFTGLDDAAGQVEVWFVVRHDEEDPVGRVPDEGSGGRGLVRQPGRDPRVELQLDRAFEGKERIAHRAGSNYSCSGGVHQTGYAGSLMVAASCGMQR